MNEIQVLQFETYGVRMLMHEDGSPRWVATDVCQALGISNTTNALKRLSDHQKGLYSVKTPGGEQDINIVTEGGLNKLIMTSRAERAERFKDWVCDDVLPTIRKTGKYEMGPPKDPILAMLEVATQTRLAQLELERRQAALESAVQVVQESADEAKNIALAAQYTVTGAPNFVAIVGFAQEHGFKLTEEELRHEGTWFANFCRKHGFAMKKIPHQKYSKQNAYDREALEKYWLPTFKKRRAS